MLTIQLFIANSFVKKSTIVDPKVVTVTVDYSVYKQAHVVCKFAIIVAYYVKSCAPPIHSHSTSLLTLQKS